MHQQTTQKKQKKRSKKRSEKKFPYCIILGTVYIRLWFTQTTTIDKSQHHHRFYSTFTLNKRGIIISLRTKYVGDSVRI